MELWIDEKEVKVKNIKILKLELEKGMLGKKNAEEGLLDLIF